MMETKCPQCNKELKSPSTRLVQDSCGHKKCRICLLQDEAECQMCLQKRKCQASEHEELGVIKYENNHAAVITYNKQTTRANADRSVAPKTDANNVDVNTEVDAKPLESNENKTDRKESDKQKRVYNYLTIPSHIILLNEHPGTYKCNICSKTFRTKSHVKYHSYCAGGQKPLSCKECSKEFISKYHLEVHQMAHAQKKLYVCNVCDKSFRRFGILNRHKFIHLDTKQFVCQQCGKTFKSKDYLQRHILIHKTDKPFSCGKCSAKFNNRSNLNKHQGTHSKDKIHMCDECGKRFKFKNALTVHRRSHLRIRPHKCPECSKTFVNLKEMNRHQLIHLEVKAYACSLCEVSFRRKDNLQRHIRNTHPGRKATLIKKPPKRVRIKRAQSETPPENPNAIKVITAPPTCIASTGKSEPVLSKPVPVINAPLKLAFKTTAFKSHYNIHGREYVEPARILPKPYDCEESINICKKILSPSSPPQSHAVVKTLNKMSEKGSTKICQKILSPFVPPVTNTDMSFERLHCIRNIKFKLPPKYLNSPKNMVLNDITGTKPKPIDCSDVNIGNELNKDATYIELKPVPPTNAATSVIVNTSTTSQNEMHWRRRTLQNLEMQSKHLE